AGSLWRPVDAAATCRRAERRRWQPVRAAALRRSHRAPGERRIRVRRWSGKQRWGSAGSTSRASYGRCDRPRVNSVFSRAFYLGMETLAGGKGGTVLLVARFLVDDETPFVRRAEAAL